MMRGYGYGGGFGGPGIGHPLAGLFGAVVFLLVVAAAVALVVWLVRRGAAPGVAHVGGNHVALARPAGEQALSVAMNRFASGEITREQYEEIRDTLQGVAPRPTQ